MSLAFAQGSQRLVIKMTGGVTFYTSFEVQPVTTIMLKERGRKKNFTSMLHNFKFRGAPLSPPSSVHRWRKKKNARWRASFHHPETAAVRKLQRNVCMQDISL